MVKRKSKKRPGRPRKPGRRKKQKGGAFGLAASVLFRNDSIALVF